MAFKVTVLSIWILFSPGRRDMTHVGFDYAGDYEIQPISKEHEKLFEEFRRTDKVFRLQIFFKL